MSINAKAISVSELVSLIKNSLPKKNILVKGEVEQPKLSNGHLYFTFRHESTLVKGIIWRSKMTQIKQKIMEGDSVEVFAKLDYYGGNGMVNLIVQKIKSYHGLGELYKQLEERKKIFQQKGYFDKKNKLPLPKKITKIALVTSSTGAAIYDFNYGLDKSNMKLDIMVEHVIVQGPNCPKNVSAKIDQIKDNQFDLIVVTRGGGSFQDLYGFSSAEIVESAYKCNTPILSAIGHQVDTSLLDLVADVTCPTPSLAAQYIVDHNMKYLSSLENIRIKCKDKILDGVLSELNKYNRIKQMISRIVYDFLQKKTELQHKLLNEITNDKVKLEYLLKLLDQQTDKLTIKLKSDKNVEIKNLLDIINKIKKKEPFIIDINGNKIKITNYDYQMLSKNNI